MNNNHTLTKGCQISVKICQIIKQAPNAILSTLGHLAKWWSSGQNHWQTNNYQPDNGQRGHLQTIIGDQVNHCMYLAHPNKHADVLWTLATLPCNPILYSI